jgi:hypothetical protein
LYEIQPIRLRDISGLVVAIGQITMLFCKALTIATKTLVAGLQTLSFSTILSIVLWAFGAFTSHYFLDTLSLYIMATMFAVIFLNLGERKAGEMSAYSVFNDGFEEILGTLNANQFDREIRHNMMVNNDHESDDDKDLDYYIPSDEEDEDGNHANSSSNGKDRKLNEKKGKEKEKGMDDEEEYIEVLKRREIAKKVQVFQLLKKFEILDGKLHFSSPIEASRSDNSTVCCKELTDTELHEN